MLVQEGVRRETVEESGVDIETLALMAVEFQSSQWIRFSFTGEAASGGVTGELCVLPQGDQWEGS